jgi:hypothetical protein
LVECIANTRFHRLHNFHPPTYETGTLRRFHLGRTDIIRLPNTESAHFVHTMRDGTANANTRAQALRDAARAHADYGKQVGSGQCARLVSHAADNVRRGHRSALVGSAAGSKCTGDEHTRAL